MPRYRIEFFELTIDPTSDYGSGYEALRALSSSPDALTAEVGSYLREFSRLAHHGASVRGSFRKFRAGDLPEKGKIGGRSEPIELEDGEGLIERNYFSAYRQQNLFLWHTNGHANAPSHFEKALAKLLGTPVSLNPLIEKDALGRLMRGEAQLRSLEVSIPRPKDPLYYPDSDFGKHVMEALAGADGDRIRIEITTDARRRGAKAKLKGKIKAALKELVSDEVASTARAVVVDEDGQHPIDLIADRLLAHTEIEHDGRYPPSEEMFRAFDRAKADHQEAINDCLGGVGKTLR